MKNFILFIFVGAASLSACGQKLKDIEVPASVKASFTKQFPNIKKVTWSRESEAEYEAEFKTKGSEQSANFDSNGNWLETETEIEKADVPSNVIGAVEKEFPGYQVEEAELAETKDNGTFYELEIEKGEVSYELSVSKDGKILKKEEKKE
jgi:uncharacterized membrane protein YkoI